MGDIFLALILIGGVALYFTPTIIAWNKPQANSVIAVNLFLGWTIIGWVAALAWAFVDQKQPDIINHATHEDQFDKLKKLKDLLDSGAITPEEYAIEKQKLLN